MQAAKPVSVSSIGYVEKRHQRYAFPWFPKEKVIKRSPPFLHKALDGKRRQLRPPVRWESPRRQNGCRRSGMDLTWDDSAGQYYGRLDSQNGEQQLWMEETKVPWDSRWILIKKYDLAGVAGWRLGAGKPATSGM